MAAFYFALRSRVLCFKEGAFYFLLLFFLNSPFRDEKCRLKNVKDPLNVASSIIMCYRFTKCDRDSSANCKFDGIDRVSSYIRA